MRGFAANGSITFAWAGAATMSIAESNVEVIISILKKIMSRNGRTDFGFCKAQILPTTSATAFEPIRVIVASSLWRYVDGHEISKDPENRSWCPAEPDKDGDQCTRRPKGSGRYRRHKRDNRQRRDTRHRPAHEPKVEIQQGTTGAAAGRASTTGSEEARLLGLVLGSGHHRGFGLADLLTTAAGA